MTVLSNYDQFEGRYWDTGGLCNVLAYQGTRAPHTGQPYTEAMLLGISGGITFGYFTFHYRGYDPQVNLLTRNTFEPMDRILERLAIPHEVKGTTDPDTARQNLLDALDDGQPPIVWPDGYMLPYNALEYDDNNWMPMPVIIYGYDPEADEAYIADRAQVGLSVTAEELDDARARVKKDRYCQMLVESPDGSLLREAVCRGIQDAITLTLEGPPRGSARNFGLSGLQHWADMLTARTKDGWQRSYPLGRSLLSVLMSAFHFAGPPFGKTMQAERDTYADFLDEATQVLDNTALNNVAARYRMAGQSWEKLLHALLPDNVPMLKQARDLMMDKHRLFMEHGSARVEEMQQLENEMDNLKHKAERDFPLSNAEAADLRDSIRQHVLAVHDAEAEAIHALKAAMG